MRDFLDVLIPVGGIIAALVAAFLVVFGLPNYLFGARNVAELRREAPAFLDRSGFTVIANEGFTYGLISQPGGCVWYLMHRKGEQNTVYNGCVAKWWDGSYELWTLRAVNAIEGGSK